MSRARADSDDLPGELEGIWEDDDEPQRPNFDDSDEFDPTSLLSQPLFDDSNGDLDVNEAELADIQASRGRANNSMEMMSNINMNQQNLQQPNNNFSAYDMNASNHRQQHMPNGMNFYSSTPPADPLNINHAMQPQQKNVNFQVQKVQRKVQQVQDQIQRVQIESNSGMGSPPPQSSTTPQSQDQQGIQTGFDLQTLMNQAGMNNGRNPPGRSVSMPIRRNLMTGVPMNNQPTFMMQQPMQQLHQQQAMMNTSNDSSAQSGSMNNSMHNFNQGMDQQQQMVMSNNLDGPMPSQMNSMQTYNNQGLLMEQLQQGMMGASLDASMHSGMDNNMQVFNQGMDGSMNSPLANMHQQQGLSGMNNSAQSMPNSVLSNNNMGMDMTVLQQRGTGNMPNMPFVDNGGSIRSNSSPQNNSSNFGTRPNQVDGDNNMLQPQNFDLAQMQRSFQAQGLIPGPAGTVQQGQMGQGGQPGVNGAMEKLCESMRRSAMSRSMVKQLSGRSISRTNSGRVLTKQPSSRSVSRQNSGRMTKQLSGRGLSRANSGRQLQRSASSRGTDGELPVRRLGQGTKHRIQRDALSSSLHTPGRGVLRHKSQSAAMGENNNKTVLNIDGNSIGPSLGGSPA